MAGTPPHVTHIWIQRDARTNFSLPKLAQVNSEERKSWFSPTTSLSVRWHHLISIVFVPIWQMDFSAGRFHICHQYFLMFAQPTPMDFFDLILVFLHQTGATCYDQLERSYQFLVKNIFSVSTHYRVSETVQRRLIKEEASMIILNWICAEILSVLRTGWFQHFPRLSAVQCMIMFQAF